MFYEEVFRELHIRKVRYIVAGGIAVNLHGVPRVTQDLDILIDLEKPNIDRFSKVMIGLGYKSRMPVKIEEISVKKNRQDWIKHKHMKVFSLWNKDIPYKIVDVFIENPIDFKLLYKNRVEISIGEFKIPIVSIQYLIKLKKIAGRKQDISDIVSLKRVKELGREK